MMDFIDMNDSTLDDINDMEDITSVEPNTVPPKTSSSSSISAERLHYLAIELEELTQHLGYKSDGYSIIVAALIYIKKLQGDIGDG